MLEVTSYESEAEEVQEKRAYALSKAVKWYDSYMTIRKQIFV